MNLTREQFFQHQELQSFEKDSLPTFTIVPYAILDNRAVRDSLLEHTLAFELRYVIETNGYKYVLPSNAPKFIVALNLDTVSSAYDNNLILDAQLPQQFDLNNYTHSFAILSPKDTVGRPSFLSDSSWNTQVFVDQYPVKWRYVRARAFVFNARTNKLMWTATGVTCRPSADLAITGQNVVRGVMWDLPRMGLGNLALDTSRGRFGLGLFITTFDGRNFWPVLSMVSPNSTGAHDLQYGDIILEVQNQSTRNCTLVEVLRMCVDAPGKTAEFKIARGAHVKTISLTRKPSWQLN